VVNAVDYSMARLGVVLPAGGARFCDTGRLRGAELSQRKRELAGWRTLSTARQRRPANRDVDGPGSSPKQSMRQGVSCLSEPTAACCSVRWRFGLKSVSRSTRLDTRAFWQKDPLRLSPVHGHNKCNTIKSEQTARPPPSQRRPPAPATRPPPAQWSALLPIDDSRNHQQPFQARF
jgi:hypothetical protein